MVPHEALLQSVLSLAPSTWHPVGAGTQSK